MMRRFQSTLPLRGATAAKEKFAESQTISIHAPLTGSDGPATSILCPWRNFNPRSPYGERPRFHFLPVSFILISIHAPLTGSDPSVSINTGSGKISIHAPLTGSDGTVLIMLYSGWNFNPRSPYGERPSQCPSGFLLFRFQSTLPLRGATGFKPLCLLDFWISIHAPLTGSDEYSYSPPLNVPNFNPRSPYGERRPTSLSSAR